MAPASKRTMSKPASVLLPASTRPASSRVSQPDGNSADHPCCSARCTTGGVDDDDDAPSNASDRAVATTKTDDILGMPEGSDDDGDDGSAAGHACGKVHHGAEWPMA